MIKNPFLLLVFCVIVYLGRRDGVAVDLGHLCPLSGVELLGVVGELSDVLSFAIAL